MLVGKLTVSLAERLSIFCGMCLTSAIPAYHMHDEGNVISYPLLFVMRLTKLTGFFYWGLPRGRQISLGCWAFIPQPSIEMQMLFSW